MRLPVLLCALVLAFAAPAGAQPAPQVDPAAVTQARTYMTKVGVPTLMRMVLNSTATNMRRVLEASNPGKADAIGEMMTMYVTELDQRLPALLDAIAVVYARHLTAEELADINRFYDTPTGQKLIKELPGILKEAQAIGAALGGQLAQQVMEKLAPELQKRNLKLEPNKT
jgi:hypothetical protein